MKILVLTCPTGGGHNACANYIKEEFNLNNIVCDVKNYLDIIGKNTSNIVEKLYLDSTKGKGNIFKNVYKLGELYNKSNIVSPVYLFNKLHKDKLAHYIKDNGYDLIICTHLFPSMALTEIKKEDIIHFINVATDYECIPFWNETTPDYFVIPSKLLTDDFIKKDFKNEILLPIGIPISSNFKKVTKKNTNKLPQVLITSGSMGFGNMKLLVTKVLKEIPYVDFYIICGGNKKLVAELKNIDSKFLHVIGYTKEMNEYMINSDIIVTKPGGLTTTEVAVLHKPLIHMMPIPGVENYNANFFAKNHMSLRAINIEEVIKNIKLLLNDKNLAQELVKNQKAIINENSGVDLVEFVQKTYIKKALLLNSTFK